MPTIYLEFQHEAQHASGSLAANGSDIVMFVDGRFGPYRRDANIYEQVERLRSLPGSRYRNQLFVGYSKPRNHRLHPMTDPNPPAWAIKKED